MKLKKQNILIIKHGAFGDLIQSDGIFRTIKDMLSKCKSNIAYILFITRI